MKKIRKILITMLIIVALSIIQNITAFAYYDRVCDLTSDELYDEVWNMFYFDNFQSFEGEENEALALEMSITRYELKDFLIDYEPINRDVNVSDVEKEYYQYLQEVVFKDIEMATDEDGNIYEYFISNPAEKYFWVYDKSSNKFVCSDADNKIIKTYDRYYPENKTSAQASKKSINNSNSGSNVSSQKCTSNIGEDTTTSATELTTNPATVDTVDTEKNNTGMTTTQIIILCIIGAMIVAGLIFIGFTATKKKKGE